MPPRTPLTPRKTTSPGERVGAWYTVFSAVRDELTTRDAREVFRTITADEALRLPAAMEAARAVMANDRTAAIVAAILISHGGVRVVPTEVEEG